MLNINLPNRIKFLREKKGYTQQYVADVLGVHRSTYSYYETGKTEPSLDSIIKLSNLYDISLDRLLKRQSRKH
ncbi:MAG: helix-turn-helix transcriptional regulator [Clostridia bacterium]